MVRRIGGSIHNSISETTNIVRNSNDGSSPSFTTGNDGLSSSSTTPATLHRPSPLNQAHLSSKPVSPKGPKQFVDQRSLPTEKAPSTKLLWQQDSLPARVCPNPVKQSLTQNSVSASVLPTSIKQEFDQKSVQKYGSTKATGNKQGLLSHEVKTSSAPITDSSKQTLQADVGPDVKFGAKPSEIRAVIQKNREKARMEQDRKESVRKREEAAALRMKKIKDEIDAIKQKERESDIEAIAEVIRERFDYNEAMLAARALETGVGPKLVSDRQESAAGVEVGLERLHCNDMTLLGKALEIDGGPKLLNSESDRMPATDVVLERFDFKEAMLAAKALEAGGGPKLVKSNPNSKAVAQIVLEHFDFKEAMLAAKALETGAGPKRSSANPESVRERFDHNKAISEKVCEGGPKAVNAKHTSTASAEAVLERFDFKEAMLAAKALEAGGGPKIVKAQPHGNALPEISLERFEFKEAMMAAKALEADGGPKIVTSKQESSAAEIVLERFDFKEAMLAAKALEAGGGPKMAKNENTASTKGILERFDVSEQILAAKALETGAGTEIVTSNPDSKAVAEISLERFNFKEAMLAAKALEAGGGPKLLKSKADSKGVAEFVLERFDFKEAMLAAKALEAGGGPKVLKSKPDSKPVAEVVLERFDFKEAMLAAKALEAGGGPKTETSKQTNMEKVNSVIDLTKNMVAKPVVRAPLKLERKRSKVEEEVEASRVTKELALEEMMVERLSAEQEKEEENQAARVIGGKALMEFSDLNMPMDELMHFQNPQSLSISAAVLAASPPPPVKTTLEATPEGKLRRVPGRRGVERTASNRVPEMRRRANQRDLLFDDDDKRNNSAIQRQRIQNPNVEDNASSAVPSEGASSLRSERKSSMVPAREAREAAKQEDERRINVAQKEELEKARAHFEKGHDLCWKGNDSAAALVDYRKALFTRESILGKYHEETGRSYFWIGKSLTKLKDFDEALMAYSRAFRIFERVLTKSNKYNVWTVTAIESVFRQMDEPDVDYASYKERLEKSIRHEQSGDQLRKRGKLAEAIVDYREAIDNLEEYHPDAADLYCKIAIIMRQQGDFDRALEEYRCASEIYELSLGAEHPETVKTLNQLIEKKRLNQKSLALMEKLKLKN